MAQARRRAKKTQGPHDDWKEMNFAKDGSVRVVDRDGTTTRYENRKDLRTGKWKEINFAPRKKRK